MADRGTCECGAALVRVHGERAGGLLCEVCDEQLLGELTAEAPIPPSNREMEIAVQFVAVWGNQPGKRMALAQRFAVYRAEIETEHKRRYAELHAQLIDAGRHTLRLEGELVSLRLAMGAAGMEMRLLEASRDEARAKIAPIIAACRREIEVGSAVGSGLTLARRILELCGEKP